MSQPCTEQDPESQAGADIEDDWNIEEGDGGWYDKELDAYDRQAAAGAPPTPGGDGG